MLGEKIMRVKYLGLVIAGSALLCCGVPAIAQQDVSVTFTGGYTGTFENFGAGVYSGTINGNASPGIICDDFNDEVSSGESWNAKAFQVSSLVSGGNLDSTLFGSTI